MNTDEKILRKFIQSHPDDALQIIENLEEKEIAALLESLPIDLSALLLSQMDRFRAVRSLEKVDQETAIHIIEKLPISITEVLLRQVDKNLCREILNRLPPTTSKPLRQILKYPKNSVGASLNPLVFTLYNNQSINQGLEKIKKYNPPIQSQVFVLDRDQKLVGFIDLKELITAEPNKLIQSIMNRNLPKINADLQISVLKEGALWDESFSSLPVVDSNEVFLGVITREMLSKINLGKNTVERQGLQASTALGDLFQIGLSSLFQSAADLTGNRK